MPTPSLAATHEPSPVIPETTATPRVQCICTGPHVQALRDLCYIGDSFGTGIIAQKPDADEVAVTVQLNGDAVVNGVDLGS